MARRVPGRVDRLDAGHDPNQAIANRRRLFDRAATDQAQVLAFHFSPFPSLGYVTTHGEGWRWHPIASGEVAGP